MSELSRTRRERKARAIRFLTDLSFWFKGTLRSRAAREVFLDTEAGRVRTLWYGFEDPAVKPVFFDLHGGGFILMRADADEEINLALRNAVGCKIVSVDYSKAPEAPFPRAIEEVYAVIKHMAARAAEYGIDPERMAIGGHSAGANFATVVSLMAAERKAFSLRCQVLDYPPTDMAMDPYARPAPKGAIPPKMADLFNSCYVDRDKAADPLVSPVYATEKQLATLPPAIVILAELDSLRDEGEKYANLMKNAGGSVDIHEFKGAAHGFTYKKSADTDRALALMGDFLRKHLYQ